MNQKIIVSILIIVGVIIVGYLLMSGDGSVSETEVLSTTPESVEFEPETVPEQDTISAATPKERMTTYVDSQYGFTFQYPSKAGKFEVEMDVSDSDVWMSFKLPTQSPMFGHLGYVTAFNVFIMSVDDFSARQTLCSSNAAEDPEVYMGMCRILDMTNPACQNANYVFRTREFFTQEPLVSYPDDAALTIAEVEVLLETFTAK